MAAFITVAAQEFPCGRGSAGARVEKRNIHLALGERVVDEWQVADDCSEETETEAAFGHNESARQARARNHITKAEREKSCAAEIDIGPEARLGAPTDEG